MLDVKCTESVLLTRILNGSIVFEYVCKLDMNRKKKIEGLFKKRLKRARAKLDTRPKGERYVSKADRAKAEAAVLEVEKNTSDN